MNASQFSFLLVLLFLSKGGFLQIIDFIVVYCYIQVL